METLDTLKSAYELERGKPRPTWNHAYLQQNILFEIRVKYPGKYTILPELNLLVLGEKLLPDLAIFEGSRSFLAHDLTLISELPLTAVEIISPSQGNTELADKAERYLQAGVKSCWIVVPEYRSLVHSTQPGSYTTFNQHDTLRDPATGIELELARLFA